MLYSLTRVRLISLFSLILNAETDALKGLSQGHMGNKAELAVLGFEPLSLFLVFFFLELHTNYRKTKVGRYTLSARERTISVHVFQGSDYI